MARPTTDELKYYSRDTKSQENEQYIEAMHGILGFAILEKLRMHIYGGTGGYYCEFNNISKRLFCKSNGISLDQLESVLKDCFLPEIRLFDKELHDRYGILTSCGIQKRWKKIVIESGRKKTVINPEYCLLTEDKTPVTPQETTSNSPINSHTSALIVGETPGNSATSTQTKLNETKLKEKKGKENISEIGAGNPPAPPQINSEVEKKEPVRKKFIVPPETEVQHFFLKSTAGSWRPELAKLEAKKMFNHYQSNGWKQNGNKLIVDWKAAANGWILREGNFAPATASQAAKVETVTDPALMEKEVEFLYQRFLENQLRPGLIKAAHYDFLKKRKIEVSDKERQVILKDCALIRKKQLEGSNEGNLLRLAEAYEKYDFENPAIIADQPAFHKLTKAAAVEKIFTNAREEGKQILI